jgi:hypothetical protein
MRLSSDSDELACDWPCTGKLKDFSQMTQRGIWDLLPASPWFERSVKIARFNYLFHSLINKQSRGKEVQTCNTLKTPSLLWSDLFGKEF